MSSGRVVQKDRKKTSSNYRSSIGEATRKEHVATSPAVLMAEATIPVTTLSGRKGNGRFRVVYVRSGKLANDSQSCETSETAFKEEGIISSTDLKSVCSQEVITNRLRLTHSL
ncbi:hypothetical protein TNCV_4853811 [Trichonephila clavipes]|nr:hypothetical protein TNCV_4853811 [Trichonephila clavipes]